MKRAMTFYYNEDTGELSKVDISERFRMECDLMQADVLQDILNEVTGEYEASLKGAFPGIENEVPA